MTFSTSYCHFNKLGSMECMCVCTSLHVHEKRDICQKLVFTILSVLCTDSATKRIFPNTYCTSRNLKTHILKPAVFQVILKLLYFCNFLL